MGGLGGKRGRKNESEGEGGDGAKTVRPRREKGADARREFVLNNLQQEIRTFAVLSRYWDTYSVAMPIHSVT